MRPPQGKSSRTAFVVQNAAKNSSMRSRTLFCRCVNSALPFAFPLSNSTSRPFPTLRKCSAQGRAPRWKRLLPFALGPCLSVQIRGYTFPLRPHTDHPHQRDPGGRKNQIRGEEAQAHAPGLFAQVAEVG